jgi:hypothetical protein
MICGPIPAGFDHDERVLCVLPAIDLATSVTYASVSGLV